MGDASNRKKRRRAAEAADPDSNIPNPLDGCILQPINCAIHLRGDEPKKTLPDGRLHITITKMIVTPLEDYQSLLKLARTRMKDAELRAFQKVKDAVFARMEEDRKKIQVVSELPKELKDR